MKRPEPLVPIPVTDGPVVSTVPDPMPDPGPVIGTNPDPGPVTPTITPPVRVGPRFATPQHLIEPPYPPDKQRLEEEAVLRLKLSIDERGRVVAVELGELGQVAAQHVDRVLDAVGGRQPQAHQTPGRRCDRLGVERFGPARGSLIAWVEVLDQCVSLESVSGWR